METVPSELEGSSLFCFKDFLSWHRRSGAALVAESDVVNQIEAKFGKLYVPHDADYIVLNEIASNVGKSAFVMEIIGVPGVGKTKILKELIRGLDPRDFAKYSDLVKKVVDEFQFLDVENIGTRDQKSTHEKKKVWVTLNIDEYVSTVPGKDPLGDLYAKLNAFLRTNESLIICGNIGALENDAAKKAISTIKGLIGFRNNKRLELIRIPSYESLYWTKEYGVTVNSYGGEGDPAFLTSGEAGFKLYSERLVELGRRVLENCSLSAGKRKRCEECLATYYVPYLKKLEELLENTDLSCRLHDLLQFLWLKHSDLYLVARALNMFWGYALTELWDTLEKNKTAIMYSGVDTSFIHASLYSSRMPSIYKISDYLLSEANVHRFRKKDMELDLIGASREASRDPYFRLRKRLQFFSEYLDRKESKEKIYENAFEEFMDATKLTGSFTEIARKLVLLRLDKTLLYVSEDDSRYKELFMEPWGFARILFATKVAGRSICGNGKKKLLVFHNLVLNDIDTQPGIAFEEVQHPNYYMTNREKILRIKLRGNFAAKLEKEAPTFHVALADFASLRRLTKGIGRPDISLQEATQVKVSSFLDSVESFAKHKVSPIVWHHLKNDILRGDLSRILVRTLGADTQRCNVRIDADQIVIESDGIFTLRLPKVVPP